MIDAAAEERLKLDRRIHNQRRALRDNWEIMEKRAASGRRFTLEVIRRADKLCDLLDVPRQSETGGHYTLLHRMRLAIDRLAHRGEG